MRKYVVINSENLIEIESSLKNFFIREKSRAFAGSSTYSLMKYRGISIRIKNEGTRNAVFIVGIAAYEANFRIHDGIKVQGSLGGDEQLVRKWYMYSGNKEALEKIADTENVPDKPHAEEIEETL